MDHVSRMYIKWLYYFMPWNNRFFRLPKYQKLSGFLAKEPLVLKMHLQAMFADMPDNFHLHSPLLNHRWEITKWAISITICSVGNTELMVSLADHNIVSNQLIQPDFYCPRQTGETITNFEGGKCLCLMKLKCWCMLVRKLHLINHIVW